MRMFARMLLLNLILLSISRGVLADQGVSEKPEDFFSYARGSAQRLANGNTLICESDKGRDSRLETRDSYNQRAYDVFYDSRSPALRILDLFQYPFQITFS